MNINKIDEIRSVPKNMPPCYKLPKKNEISSFVVKRALLCALDNIIEWLMNDRSIYNSTRFCCCSSEANLNFQVCNNPRFSIGNYTVREVSMKNCTRFWRNNSCHSHAGEIPTPVSYEQAAMLRILNS
jgi:hypothetical protein